MTPHTETSPSVGQQLKQRRTSLDLTQGALAALLAVTVTSISAAETDRAAIRRGKRGDWERALRLKPGTLTRAYTDGSPIEALDDPAEQVTSYANLNDPHERAVWEMALPESDRRTMIDILRSGKEEERKRLA